VDDQTRLPGPAPRLGAAQDLVVYWRPGCYFCTRLLNAFDRAGVLYEMRDIWQDDSARELVRAHNRGDETVPTVVLGEVVSTNPDPQGYIDWLSVAHPEMIGGSPGAEEGCAGAASTRDV
jgi:glutaredoxin